MINSDYKKEYKPKTEAAKEAERLVQTLPPDVRAAVEAMQRTTKARRVYTAETKSIRYEHTE